MRKLVSFTAIAVLAFALLAGCNSPVDPNGGGGGGGGNNPSSGGGGGGGKVAVTSVNRFVAKEYPLNDKIKYSVSCGDLDFYYIYLGEMRNIPLYTYDTYLHNGVNSTYTISKEEYTKEIVQNTVSGSRQTVLGYVDNYTVSETFDIKLSQEINAKFGLFGAKTEVKLAAEEYWSKVKTSSTSTNTQYTTSLTDTTTHGTEYTIATRESRTWLLDQDNKVGFYRYSLFSASAVYLYVIKDRGKPGEIYYEFREHVIPGVYFWGMDYSEDPFFTKSDESRFGFDVLMLDNLPKPTNDIPTNDIPINNIPPSYNVTFNSNGGSYVPGQTVVPNGTATRPPADPYLNGYVFVNWYSDQSLNTVYNFSTSIVKDTILYAKWGTVPGNDLADKMKWLQNNALNNRAYIVEVDRSDRIAPQLLFSGNRSNVTITLKGIGNSWMIQLDNSTVGSLFTVGSGVALILDNITLQGKNGNNAPLVQVNSGGTLIMRKGSAITGNVITSNDDGGGVLVYGGTFTMDDGEISHNKSRDYGGGVYVFGGGYFTMNGGEISDNTSLSYGGGVFVNNGGTFNMKGGKITNNTTGEGGGVLSYGTFTMSGGEIINNNSSSNSGGVYVTGSGGTFTMDGGKISGNKSSYRGGGVSVWSYSTFTMNGGEISGNRSSERGGGVFMNDGGSFIMNNGKISGNTSAFVGGGVSAAPGTRFTMNNGEISGNTTPNYDGGGVYVGGTGATFTMSGGNISGNNAATKGGGVSGETNGTFTMSGGNISGNNAATKGGGVSMESGATFNMSGGTISGNNVATSGGGVFVNQGNFTKTGGTIYGYTVGDVNSNVVKDNSGVVQNNRGHAVYVASFMGGFPVKIYPEKRKESTAGTGVDLSYRTGYPAPTWSGGWE
jgi:uncharacterized repeat protein (TIGR02543 family)